MIYPSYISLFDMALCLSSAADLVSPRVADHQKRVAYIALALAGQLGVKLSGQDEIVLAGLLHDIGALSLQGRIECLSFETEATRFHSEAGYLLLCGVDGLAGAAGLIRHHHAPWDQSNDQIPFGSHILHLADRIDVLIDRDREILSQVEGVIRTLRAEAGLRFAPQVVEAFCDLAVKESFWFDLVSPMIGQALEHQRQGRQLRLDLQGLADLSRLFSHTIDFRCRFTSVHSSGVAVIAQALSKILGASQLESRMIEVAGYLHDLGKLALPSEILEKPEALSTEEYSQVKAHPFLAYRLLGSVKELGSIAAWVSLHHERIDGRGYPFHIAGPDLPLAARVLAVADVFTALTEDRPYRPGMQPGTAIREMETMARDRALDGDIVSMVVTNFEEIDGLRRQIQGTSTLNYHLFTSRLHHLAQAC